MGSITLPASGTVYVDANAVIYMVEAHPVYYPLLEPIWRTAQTGQFEVVTSLLTLMESLVGPVKTGDAKMISAFEKLFASPDLRFLPIDETTLRRAAQLRATIAKLRTPDAIHAATALIERSSLFVTNDPDFRNIPGLPVTVLSDLIP